jgi:hypothetical protein
MIKVYPQLWLIICINNVDIVYHMIYNNNIKISGEKNMTQQSKYRYYYDDGHGWLEVPNADVKASAITVTPYSYYDPKSDMAYLEEDVDLIAFLQATGKTLSDICTHIHSSMPRKLQHI